MPAITGYDFWRNTLKEAKLVVAPMVDASELAWRMLSRRYGAQLCYTPMLHACVFIRDARYRKDSLQSCEEDRPLIVQFCANNPDMFAEACRLAAPHCDAVDLNLGCPQTIARKGHYGAFLQDHWTLIEAMVKKAVAEVDIPITVKIRVFPNVEDTVRYAKMLEDSGVSLLTVHGRTREQKGPLTGLASWEQIRAVKDALRIPVLANGNVQFFGDIDRCLRETRVDGVMSAEGNLYNPALFSGLSPPVWQMAIEYLDLVRKYPCPLSYSRGHVFRIIHHCFTMEENFDLRFRMSKASRIDDMEEVVRDLESRFQARHSGAEKWEPELGSPVAKLPLPPWICQPYVRIPPEEHMHKLKESQERALFQDQSLETSTKRTLSEFPRDQELSKKKLKKLQRNSRKNFHPSKDTYPKCICKSPRGARCSYELCRNCCKKKCFQESVDCPGHRVSGSGKEKKLMQDSSKESAISNGISSLEAVEVEGRKTHFTDNVPGTIVGTSMKSLEDSDCSSSGNWPTVDCASSFSGVENGVDFNQNKSCTSDKPESETSIESMCCTQNSCVTKHKCCLCNDYETS